MVRIGEPRPPTRPPHKPPHGGHEHHGDSHAIRWLAVTVEDLTFAVNRLAREISRLHGVFGVRKLGVSKVEK